ncbi:hypothetical protein L6164_002909 [Bauhinia variegata]|uniref:Uncharacterized protein n=1 Tax=Bauhinia variegata TaxID=167791 RepID=A0ACB9PZU1_BAUVA|nr:hypothetical protein L6164_002909 [Bauhinia variegata]
MEKPQRALQIGDWKSFKRFFQEDKRALLETFDLAGNTAIHITAISNKHQLLKEFLEMISPRDRWHALRRRNHHQSILLHSVNTSVEIAEVVLNCEKELPLPPDDEIDPPEMEEKELPLLESRNLMGETPIYRAAIDGNLKLLKCLTKKVADLEKHFHRNKDKVSILHAAVAAQRFVALWLLNLDDKLAYEKDDNGCTSLQLLSTMPSVFRSGTQYGILKQWIYDSIYDYFLPEFKYHEDDNDARTNDHIPTSDIEKGENTIKPHISVLSRINSAIWNRLSKEWDGINFLMKKKKKNMLAEQLADVLVRRDSSWQKSFIHKLRTPKISPAILGSNVTKLVKQTEPSLEKQYTEQITHSNSEYTPLLLAAATGIVEIVEKLLERYPQVINHVSEDGLNMLHVAVMYRQREIYKIIKKIGAWQWLKYRLSTNGDSLLHQVGKTEFYKKRQKSGIAFQLQEELLWFHRVHEILPHFLIIHCNDDNLTAEDLFDKQHDTMLKDAREWMKDTAQSCSTVAVLVATVVFAAAYTIPGGTNERGLPIFLSSPIFLLFTIMDVVALASSLASVVMFLSILTSPFEMQDFRRSLPLKLSVGFSLLFFSLITTMLAFSTTVLLTIRLEKEKWTSTLVYSAAFFPVAVFGLFQFPFMVAAIRISKEIKKKLAKVLPNSVKRSISSKVSSVKKKNIENTDD